MIDPTARIHPRDPQRIQRALEIYEITGKSAPVLQLAKRAQYESYYSSFPEALQNIQAMYIRDLMSLSERPDIISLAGGIAGVTRRGP